MTSTKQYKYLPPNFVERLRGAEIGVKRPMSGGRQNQHLSKAFGASVEFAQYREYYQGDPLQRIDWSVYARTDRHVVRESHEEVSVRSYVLLDISRSMLYKEDGNMSKMDFACYLAAGMMYMMIQQGDCASLITFDSELRDYHPATSTAVGLKPMLLQLEDIEPSEEGDIEASLHQIADLIKGRAQVVLISDLLQEPKEVMRGIHHLYHGGKDITAFHVMDPAELTLPMTGLTDLIEMEDGSKLTVDLDEVRENYLHQVQEYLDELQRGCMNLRLDYYMADTHQEVHSLLRKRSAQT